MPMVPVTLPSVWDIPVAAGVPALLGQSVTTGIRAAASVSLGTVLDDLMISQAAGQWGIFTSAGTCVLSAARVMSVSAESSSPIATAPLEDGAFLSYSKVQTPRQHRVLMVCDGSETGLSGTEASLFSGMDLTRLAGVEALYVRKTFFNTLAALEADLSLYAVITPERKYSNVSITGHRWVRDARHGITMPMVEITLQEVRLTGTQTFTQTQTPQGSRTICTGLVSARSLMASGYSFQTASASISNNTLDAATLLKNTL
ncbi:phage baseplate protein [Acetobacter sp. P1H12_c]|uniref:phage baseplate protein n=1 Tax=Acetobacter sp. P1H12_c TaxID=2762621 RepID=UPI001C044F09|nr:hypothetical protein [Acetobacter sp. P1H12_c]